MLASVLAGLIVWPQTNIGPTKPPYNFPPILWLLLMALKFSYSVLAIRHLIGRLIVTTRSIQQ